MKRILVIYVARLGDTLLISPILHALKEKYPQAELTFLGHKRSIELTYHLPFVNRVGSISKTMAPWLGRFFGKAYDVALVYGIDLPLVAYAERVAKQVICFENPGLLPSPSRSCISRPSEIIHAVDERAMLLAPLGIILQDKHLKYVVTPEEQAWAKAFLAQHKLDQHFLVALKPQSFVDKNYRDWPITSTLEFCQRFLVHKPESHFLFFGNQADRAPLEPIVKALSSHATSLAGMLSLRQTAALMQQVQLYLGVDTGLTHLAGALGLPMVALYHCRHRGRFLAPLQLPRCYVVEHPCSDSLCTVSTSMIEISVEGVFNAAVKATSY
jgi:heptosyltransferase III